MPEKYKFELQTATDKLIREILHVTQGETVVITADTCSNEQVVNTTAASVQSAGGKPIVIWISTPSGVGKAADKDLPLKCLSAVLETTDVWIEYNQQWLLYSTPYENAVERNSNLRYICMVEMNPDMLIRNIGQVDLPKLATFMKIFTDKVRNAQSMKITSSIGTNLTFTTNPTHFVSCDVGDASQPGIHMLPGQINVVPKFGTVNGDLVFDGSVVPPCGVLKESIRLKIKASQIVEISGGFQAREFEKWLKRFNDPNMLKMAHIAFGLNPGAKLTGNIVEDERVWGVTEWGIGYVSVQDAPPTGQDAKSHCDGICLNSSVWFDDECIMENGQIISSDLQDLSFF